MHCQTPFRSGSGFTGCPLPKNACSANDTAMNGYQDDAPQILRDFLAYHETIKAHSQKTVDEYFLDLRNFFRYMKQSRDRSLRDTPWDDISIMDVDLDFVRSITLTDVYGYLTYLSRDRAQRPNSDRTEYGLSAATRSRKIATLRSFFNYLTNKAHLLEDNPVKELDSPKLKKTVWQSYATIRDMEWTGSPNLATAPWYGSTIPTACLPRHSCSTAPPPPGTRPYTSRFPPQDSSRM